MLRKFVNSLGMLVAISLLAGCDQDASFAKKEVSFSKDVLPILHAECQVCHAEGSEGFNVSGFSAKNYESVMKGTTLGPVVKPGESISSTLYVLISGTADPSIQMPRHDESLTAGLTNRLQQDEVDLIARWIDEGAKNN